MSLRSEVIRIFNELLAGSKKITELPSATTPLAGTELIEIVQDGENRKVASSAVGGGGGAGGTQDLQSVLDEGSTANIGDSQSNLTAEDASNYGQWNVTASSVEIANSNVANTAAAILSVDTDGAHVNDTRVNRGLQGGADYSANIQAYDYTQKVYVDTKSPKVIQLAASDEGTSLTTGAAKVTFRMPFAMTLTAIRASLSTAQATGSTLTIDVKESGSSILSTLITIDNTEKTSTTAATPPVISDADLADDAEITVDIDQVGDGTATGLKITLIGI